MQSIPKPMERNGYGIPLSSANCNLNFENKLNIKERNVDDAAAAAALEFVFSPIPAIAVAFSSARRQSHDRWSANNIWLSIWRPCPASTSLSSPDGTRRDVQ